MWISRSNQSKKLQNNISLHSRGIRREFERMEDKAGQVLKRTRRRGWQWEVPHSTSLTARGDDADGFPMGKYGQM